MHSFTLMPIWIRRLMIHKFAKDVSLGGAYEKGNNLHLGLGFWGGELIQRPSKAVVDGGTSNVTKNDRTSTKRYVARPAQGRGPKSGAEGSKFEPIQFTLQWKLFRHLLHCLVLRPRSPKTGFDWVIDRSYEVEKSVKKWRNNFKKIEI